MERASYVQCNNDDNVLFVLGQHP